MSKNIKSYSPTNPNRVNPEFVGIVDLYSQHKKNRQRSDQQRVQV